MDVVVVMGVMTLDDLSMIRMADALDGMDVQLQIVQHVYLRCAARLRCKLLLLLLLHLLLQHIIDRDPLRFILMEGWWWWGVSTGVM